MPFLIDGHNVIAALRDIDLEDPDDEAKLVMKLRAWSSRVQRKAIVIFDGGVPGGFSRTMSTVDVGVVFAARLHSNADRIIGERLRSLPDAPNWTVVSSDREILDQARATGARVLSAQEFADWLERPPAQEKVKPDTVSPVDVDDWLQIFQEPETDMPSAPPAPTPRQADPDPKSTAMTPYSRRRASTAPEVHTRTIGDQLGIDVPPDPEALAPSEKPRSTSAEEVESWLRVFHDDPNSTVAPPNLPTSTRKPSAPAAPLVKKAGALSESEVDAWLSVFEESQAQGTKPQQVPAAPVGTAKPRGVSRKLAKHQEQVAPAEGEETPDLSPEDLDLWHRLFGDT